MLQTNNRLWTLHVNIRTASTYVLLNHYSRKKYFPQKSHVWSHIEKKKKIIRPNELGFNSRVRSHVWKWLKIYSKIKYLIILTKYWFRCRFPLWAGPTWNLRGSAQYCTRDFFYGNNNMKTVWVYMNPKVIYKNSEQIYYVTSF